MNITGSIPLKLLVISYERQSRKQYFNVVNTVEEAYRGPVGIYTRDRGRESGKLHKGGDM